MLAKMIWRFIPVVMLSMGLSAASGRNAMEFDSHYLGDGWFQYSVRTLDDPFVSSIRMSQIDPIPFTNYVESIAPEHWTNAFYPEWSGISFDNSVPQPRLNEVTFMARSSETHFRKQAGGIFVFFFVTLSNRYFPSTSGGGYVRADGLVPCSAAEADGSPPYLISGIEIVHDLKIDGLVVTTGQVYGLEFSWSQPSTFQVEASHDMQNWSVIAQFFTDTPHTTWTTNAPLNSYGEFFRLVLLGAGHLSNSIVATQNSASAGTDIPIRLQTISQGRLTIEFPSAPNSLYKIELCELQGKILESQQRIAEATSTTISFELEHHSDLVFVKVRQIKK